MTRRQEDVAVLAVQIGAIAAFFAVWQLTPALGLINAKLLPPFSTVIAYLWRELQDKRFQYDALLTLSEIAVAFVVMAPTGLILGFLVGERARLNSVVQPILQFLMAIPKAMFLPFVILAFGIGFFEKVFFATVLGIFVLVMNGVAAVQSVPQGLIVAARSMGASRAQLYWRVYVPAMLPLVLTSIRIGLIFTTFGVLLAEMYASTRGLGRLIFDAGESFRLTEMLAGVVLVVFVSVLLNEALRVCEALITRRRGMT